MEIYLIRHTSVALDKGVCYGQTDVDLAESFEAESNVIRSKLENIEFNTAFSSPLTRCRRLAEKLFTSNIIYDDRLKEMSFGRWELQKWDDIDESLFQEWMNDWANVRCPEGESLLDVHKRLVSFIEEIRKSDDLRIAIICHGGIIKVFDAIINKSPLNELFKTPPPAFGEIVIKEI